MPGKLKDLFDRLRFKLIDYDDKDVLTTYDEPENEADCCTLPPHERMRRMAQDKQGKKPYFKRNPKPWE